MFTGYNPITTAVPFLTFTPDARARAMGETGAASTPDVNSIHWNGAKLAFAPKKFALGISYASWLRALVPDINLAYLSFYTRPDEKQAIGGSLRYFSMGNISVVTGPSTTARYRPNEFALDGCYSRKLGPHFSAGITARYFHSNLTNGFNMAGQSTKAANSYAVDLGAFYYRNDLLFFKKPMQLQTGISITNIGPEISYSVTGSSDFIPTNLRLGQGIVIDLNAFNQLGLQAELNKLLVPTPPVYAMNAGGGIATPPVIIAGKERPGFPVSMIQSFYDAPGGWQEELHEITIGSGLEYWYRKLFAVRCGYFYEAPSKGNRQYVTMGAGINYSVFNLDFSYLVPTNNQRNVLNNSICFTLAFNFDRMKKPSRIFPDTKKAASVE